MDITKNIMGNTMGNITEIPGGGGYRGISLWTEMGNNIYEANRKQEESKP